MEPVNNMEFMKFSDQIRLQTTNLAALSIGDSIWSDPNPADRRNLDTGWKSGFGLGLATQKLAFGNNNSIRYNNSNSNSNDVLLGSSKNSSDAYFNNNTNINNGDMKNYFNKAIGKPIFGGDVNGNGKKKSNNNGETKGMGKKKNTNNNGNDNNGGTVEKRFKTLPPAEALPRSEPVGGYIFVCNNDTMQENLKRQLFGLPPRYRDSVRAITPGLPLFLYNYSTHQLHGIFEAASFGGSNIDPTAWEDKKCPGESRFPAQVRVMTRKICGALEEDSFRPILHHYDGPKFRLELSVPEALALLDIFAENNA